MEKYDVIIIGKGPAGISTSLYTVRANLKTLIIGTDSSALAKTEKIDNYFGFANTISGKELLNAGIMQAKRLGVDVCDEEVTSIEYGNPFVVKTVDNEYMGKAILIATGQPPRREAIPGIKEFEGRGVSYCTTCDGFFYKGKKVGVLGSGNYAIAEAMELLPFTKNITIYTNGKKLSLTEEFKNKIENFKICEDKIISLKGDDGLDTITFESREEAIDGLFVASGTASSVDFAIKLGVSVENNAIMIDKNQATNLEGIFAAGDCTGGFKQIATAVGQGAMAGKSIIEYVRKNK